MMYEPTPEEVRRLKLRPKQVKIVCEGCGRARYRYLGQVERQANGVEGPHFCMGCSRQMQHAERRRAKKVTLP